jgi:hypothetical protein
MLFVLLTLKQGGYMKILGSVALVLTAAVLVSSCSSPVYVQKDESTNLAKYKTYAWVDTRANQNDTKNVSGFAQQNIHQAVNAELAKRGWTETTGNADVLVSYDVLVERSTEQRSDPVYTQPFSRVYFNPYARRWGTIYYPSQFLGYDETTVPVREGTLTLTMMDPDSDKTVWQAWTTERLDSRRMTSDEIAKAVRKILKKF